MNGHATTREIEVSGSAIVGAAWAEGLVGLGGAVLAVLGLVGILTAAFLPIAGLALGVSLLFEGYAVTNRFLKYLEAASNKRVEISTLSSGASIESLAGLAGIALGILALLNVSPLLLPVAAIIYGAAMILGGGVTSSMNGQLLRLTSETEEFKVLAGRMMAVSSNLEVLVGIGVVTLGILALLGINSVPLTLIAFIAVGTMSFIKSSTIGGRVSQVLHRHA